MANLPEPVDLVFVKHEPSTGADPNKLPLIVGHGMFSRKEDFGDLPAKLADQTKRIVYSFDLRDHGESPRTGEFTFAGKLICNWQCQFDTCVQKFWNQNNKATRTNKKQFNSTSDDLRRAKIRGKALDSKGCILWSLIEWLALHSIRDALSGPCGVIDIARHQPRRSATVSNGSHHSSAPGDSGIDSQREA